MEEYSSYLADYIKPVIDKKYRTRSDAADDLGIDQAVLSRICSGKRFGISEHLVENICMRLQLDSAEGLLRLFLSKNPKIKQHFLGLTKETKIDVVHPDNYKPAVQSNKTFSEDYSPVPFVSANSLINPKGLSSDGKIEYALVPKNFLPKKGEFIAFKAKGNSMAPTLPDGSIVAVDLGDTQESNDSIYLFKEKNEIKIGRASIQKNFLTMCPDNTNRNKFPNYIYDIAKIKKDSPIVGRVVWAFNKL